MKCGRVCALTALLLLTGCQNVSGINLIGSPVADTRTQGNIMTASNQPTTGEYLLTLKPGLPEDEQTLADLRRDLSGLPVIGLTPLGHRLYLLKVSPDPGPAAIQNAVANSRMLSAAQPNLHYGINPPKMQIQP